MTAHAALILARLLHVLAATLWVGAAVTVAVSVVPAVRATGPAGAAVLRHLTQVQKLPYVAMALGAAAILSGLYNSVGVARRDHLVDSIAVRHYIHSGGGVRADRGIDWRLRQHPDGESPRCARGANTREWPGTDDRTGRRDPRPERPARSGDPVGGGPAHSRDGGDGHRAIHLVAPASARLEQP